MIVSPLATTTIVSPNKSKRTKKIDTIVVHCMAGNLSSIACGNLFAKSSTKASSNYGIDINGNIACYVPEEYRSWATSSSAVDQRAITIEVGNDGGASTGWHTTDTALNALVDLLTDVCKRNGIKKLVWSNNKSDRVNHKNGCNMELHRDHAAKACVPTYSEVLTRNGWVKISDIEIGEEIACADLDNLRISFEEVYDKVPIKQQDTYTVNEFTATKDHRMVYRGNKSSDWRIEKLKYLLRGGNSYIIPLAGYYKGQGLNLTDDMIRFFIAVQADGHYMYEKNQDGEKRFYGLEFHVKKERKIERIKEILDSIKFDYTESHKSDGSVSIRVFNKDGVNIVQDICELYLEDKHFTWKWLEMSEEQAKLFLEEIQLWDGCTAANLYTSKESINLDIVNAIAALNGVGSRVSGSNVNFRENPVNTISGSIDIKRNTCQSKGRHTEVTCVSVKTGIFLVRQNGKTFIIGNCPGDYLVSKHPWIAEQVNARLGVTDSKPKTPTSPSTSSTTTPSLYKYNNVDMSPVFDPTFYANKYPDLKAALGTNSTLLFDHFINYGMKEARQAIATFNPVTYRNYYPDLQKAFGDNWPSYYIHYCTNGKAEGRKGI